MKIRTEIKIGFIVLATLALIIWGINYLKGRNVLKRTDVYYAIYDDVGGLKMSASVLLSGYKIGMVNDIGFMYGRLDKVLVAFYINSEYDIPVGSVAQIFNNDIMGNKVIRIIPTTSKEFHQIGDTLLSASDEGLVGKIQQQFQPLVSSATDAFLSIDTLVSSANRVFDPEIQKKLRNAVSDLESSTASLKKQLSPEGQLDKTFASLQNFTGMLEENKDKLSLAFENLENITDSVARSNVSGILSNMDETFRQSQVLLNKINKGEGSLGLLATNDSLYNNIITASQNLSVLLEDMNNHPKRYVHFSVFGKKDR